MLLRPDWPAGKRVQAFSTSRLGLAGTPGFSAGPYRGFNLGSHVGDDPQAVARNRAALQQVCEGMDKAVWLTQVHGIDVVRLDEGSPEQGLEADAAITGIAGVACIAMTADCLPVLFCDRAGEQVAAAHAGWRGLCAGVLNETLSAFEAAPGEILAWMGPAISARHFEVGREVLDTFVASFAGPDQAEIRAAFAPTGDGEHFMADLYALARAQLASLGVGWIGGGDHCTFAEAEHFYSFRRDGVCGRQASLIYLQP